MRRIGGVLIFALAAVRRGRAQIDPVDSVIREAFQASRPRLRSRRRCEGRAQEALVANPAREKNARLQPCGELAAPCETMRAPSRLEAIANPNGTGQRAFRRLLLRQVAERQRVARKRSTE